MEQGRAPSTTTTERRSWPGLDAILQRVRGRPEFLYTTLLDLRLQEAPSDQAICSLSAWPTARTESDRFATGALASVADRALFHSVIPPTEDSLQYTTVSLTVRLLHEPDPELSMTAHARARPSRSTVASSDCTLVDATGREVGTASGTFVGGRRPSANAGTSPARSTENGTAQGSTPAQPSALGERARERLRSLGPAPSYRRLLNLQTTQQGDDCLEATLNVVPHLWNTGSYLHGGVVFGAAAELATDLVSGWRIIEQHCMYLAGLGIGRVRLQARLLRRGRRVGFVAVDAFGPDGKTIAAVLCTLGPR